MSRTRLLLVSMYPLDAGLWGPTARITRLRDELARLVDLDVIDGYRAQRRPRLWRYALEGRMRGLDGIYVESSTFLPAESDLAFLGLSRALGIPVVTYVRDAYQLFPEYYPRDTLKRRLGAAAFLPAMRALRAVSSRLAFPTAGLAEAVLGPDAAAVLLPPGAPPPIDVPRSPTANRILYVGGCAAAGAWRRPADLRGGGRADDRAWISGSTSSAARARNRARRIHAGCACTTPRAPRSMRCCPTSSPRRSRGRGTGTTTSRCRSSCSTICPTAGRCS